MSKEHNIHAGGLNFRLEYRYFGGDRGPAIRVTAPVEESEVELLRFDCFEKDPHYHYDPYGKNDHRSLDKTEIPDPLSWSLDKIENEVADMVRTAGYPEVADKVNMQEVSDVVPQLRTTLGHMMPLDIGLTSIHHNSVVVTDPAKAREFYGGILGLHEVKYPSTFPNPVIWYVLGEDQIHLMIQENPDTHSGRHVALHVKDAVEARKLLKEKDIEIRETIEIPGADRFFISDPDGNQIELIEWKIPWGDGPM